MGFLYMLEKIRTPFLDAFFSAATRLGEELVFMAVAIVIFWCVSKRHGYFILACGFIGTVANQVLKLVFRIPRPWVKDPSFTIVESAREEATGYSFPSGHTQNATTTFGGIARSSGNKAIRIISLICLVLVAFSRMYLGVHTPLDVFVSLFIGAVLVLALYPLFSSEERFARSMPYLLFSMLLFGAAYLIYVSVVAGRDGGADENVVSGLENAYKLTGALAGMLVAYALDRRFIKFRTEGNILCQVLKTLLGLLVILLIKEGLKPLFGLITDSAAMDAARYFILVVVAGAVWPMTFPFFERITARPYSALLSRFGKKKGD